MSKIVSAYIDNKNLLEDAFTDDTGIFGNFYAAKDHEQNGKRHLIGHMAPRDENGFELEDGIVDAKWFFGSNTVEINVIAVSPCEDFNMVRDQIVEYYKQQFSSWECDDNPDLRVKCSESTTVDLTVHFFFEVDD